MARMRLIQIPKVISSPAEPSAPSFLSALPPEIRNGVYEALFKRDRPVLLHDAKIYHKYLSDVEDRSDFGAQNDSVNDTQFVNAKLHAEDQEFHQGLKNSIALLRTCRQIYHEAAGVLYGSNVYRFPQMPQSECCEYRTQREYAPKWLLSIGNQAALLSQVFIDLEACPTGRHCKRHRPFDMLPFLRLRWACYNFEFTQPASTTFRISAYVLNNLMVTLGDNDVLNIKRYSDFPRLMSEIYIPEKSESLKGLVMYLAHNSPPFQEYIPREFLVHNDGERVHWRPVHSDPPNLLRLPDNIKNSIFSYACTSDTDVVFDLDARKVHGLHINMLHLCHKLRVQCRSTFWDHNRIFLRTGSMHLCSNYSGYRGLRELASISGFNEKIPGFTGHNSAVATLELVGSSEAKGKNCMIDFKELWHLLPCGTSGRNIQISRKVPGDECSVSWDSLQRAFFLFVSEIIEDMLERAAPSGPEIWLDGRFEEFQAIYPATETAKDRVVTFRPACLDGEKISTLGLYKIRYLRGELVADDDATKSLIDMWATIRDNYWVGWPDEMRYWERWGRGNRDESVRHAQDRGEYCSDACQVCLNRMRI
jgi:hypothetical protein